MPRIERVTRYSELELPYGGAGFVREDAAAAGDPAKKEDSNDPAKNAGDGDDQAKAKANGAEKPKTPQTLEEMQKELARLRLSNKNKDAEAKRHYEEKMKVLQDFEGVDLDEMKLWREEKEKADRERMRREGEFEKLEAKLREELRKEKEALAAERRERENDFIEREILQAAGKHGAINPKHVLRIYRDEFQIKQTEDGKRVVVHRSEIDDDGALHSPESFLAEEKTGSGEHLFASSRKQGSGAGGGGAPESSGPVIIKVIDGQISREDQVRYEEAKKAGRPIDFERSRA